MKADGTEEASIPDRLDRFQTFAAALGIALPPEVLLGFVYWNTELPSQPSQVWSRASPSSSGCVLGRLEVPTLRKIESEWGLNARELVEGARVAILDEVILPEGIDHASIDSDYNAFSVALVERITPTSQGPR